MPEEHDRRRYPRQPLIRAGKVYRLSSLRYVPARTVNLSAGGALLEMRPTRPIAVGEPVEVAVALDGEPVVPRRTMAAGEVIRVIEQGDGSQTVAIRYIDAAVLPMERRLSEAIGPARRAA